MVCSSKYIYSGICFNLLKEFLPQIFAWGAYYVPRQTRLCEIKYGFEGSVSNVDLGQF